MNAGSISHVAAGAMVRVDVVVIGAGVAGLVAALDLVQARPGTSVALLDKGVIGESGSTTLAQGGMAAAVGPDDSPALHFADTVRAGDGLVDPVAAAVLAEEAPQRLADLEARGARFDRDPDGSLHLAREGAQSVPRCAHAADATGVEIFQALRTAATGQVVRLQGVATDLVAPPPGNRVEGVWALLDAVDAAPTGPGQDGGLSCLIADAVLLATGGCGGLYAATTNRDGATADGVALAWQAGAALADLEFVQFHPTGLRGPVDGFWRLLLTEALRGAGATLVDRDGRRFMVDRHPDAELAPRHVITKAILDQDGGAWLDATGLGAARLEREFPTVVRGARRHGFDCATAPVPVEPVQHYMIGGVATDLDGATSVPGLWAAGEAACTGVHGANRMAGNSLAQSCVFGHRAALAIARSLGHAPERPRRDPEPPTFASSPADPALRDALRRAMSSGAGPIRTADSLDGAAAAIVDLRRAAGSRPALDRGTVELHHALTAAPLLVDSARARAESRGVHWRGDAPSHVERWAGVHLRRTRTMDLR